MSPDEYTKFTESDLYKVLDNLTSYIDREQYEEHIEDVMKFINSYNGKDLLAVDDFKVFVHYKQGSYREVLLKVLLGREQELNNTQYAQEQLYGLIHYYNHIETIERLLEETIIKYEGTPFSSDKSRTILREYGKKLRGVDVSEEWDNQDYWIPNNGSKKLWLTYAEGIVKLLNGDSQQYIETKQILEGLLHDINESKEQYIQEVFTNHEYYEKEITWSRVSNRVYQFKQPLEDGDLYAELSVTDRGTLYRVYKGNYTGNTTNIGKEDAPEWVKELLKSVQ